MTQGFLFDLVLPENHDPHDDTEVNPVVIYFRHDEYNVFKKELKTAIEKLFPLDFKDKNGADAILLMLKNFNNEKNI
jgi:hypothetical protein